MTRRGFTYIELTVTLVVLLLIVSLISPSLKNLASGQEINTFKSALKSLPVSAREYAVSRGQTVQISYDEESSELTVTTVEETASTGGSTTTGLQSSRNTDTSEEGTTLRTVSVPNGVETSSFLVEGSDSEAGDWNIRFYADGTSESGGIGFTAGNYEFSLTIRSDGRGATVDGDIPDLSTERWQAGDYEQRSE